MADNDGKPPVAEPPKEGPKLKAGGRDQYMRELGTDHVARKTALEKESFVFKTKEGALQNLSHSGWGERIVRGAGVTLGAVIGGMGVVDGLRYIGFIAPKKNEKGEEIPVGVGTLFKSAAELGISALTMYGFITKGGQARALAPRL